jgi:DNA-binding LacI/PurR family transcriptional regulator
MELVLYFAKSPEEEEMKCNGSSASPDRQLHRRFVGTVPRLQIPVGGQAEKRRMAYSMKDVAERAGVSVTTVSHVINKTRYTAPATKKRVVAAIRELRFHKDAHARRLATGRSDFFGMIVSDIGNPFYDEVIKSFEAAALERRFELLLCNTNYDPQRAEAGVHMLIENKIRGVAVMPTEFAPALAEELRANGVPMVLADIGTVGPYVSNIKIEFAHGIDQAVQHLYDLGHRDLAFISGPISLRSALIRRDAFVNGVQRRGLSAGRIIEGDHKVEGGIAAVPHLVRGGSLPTAVLCSNDLTAIGLINGFQQAGIRVPEDVSVVGFDGIQLASILRPPLTTVSLSRERLGRLAFEALQKIARAKGHKGEQYMIETSLVVRGSTAHPRSAEPSRAAV